MKLTAEEINAWRMASLHLQKPCRCSCDALLARLGGVQAQDCGGAKWSLGIRLADVDRQDIEAAVSDQRIMRTWAYRGTLHLLAAADSSWVLPLIAPVITATNRRRYGELGLDEATISKSNLVIRQALAQENSPRSRSQMRALLEKEGISAEGQRAAYLLQRAALEGLICLAPSRGREPVYMPCARQAGSIPAFDRPAALGELAQRYFSSHGPATLQDFCWWSGLPAAMAREALGNASSLQAVEAMGGTMWAGKDQPPSSMLPTVLLPTFDDYLLGYRDRSAALDPAFSGKINAGGGMLRPAIVVGGKVVGIWRRMEKKWGLLICVETFRVLTAEERGSVEDAAQSYARFRGRNVEVQPWMI